MKVTETKLKGCFIIEPTVFGDSRGYFFESFNQQVFTQKTGLDVRFVQDNQSFSNRGVLRGLHIQRGEFAQAKLVRVIKGREVDVALDLRKDSETYGEYFALELSEKNHLQLFIPRGFAHGFSVLENETIFSYKCDNFYHKESEDGIMYNDPDLKIDWQLNESEIQLSEKDRILKSFHEYK